METEVQQRNPYQAPTSLIDRTPWCPTVGTEVYFFAPPLIKLVVMAFVTLGFYVVYWFYRNWKTIKQRGRDDIMPFWRALFSPLWAYSCFREIKEAIESRRNVASVSPGAMAVAYFLLNLSSRLPGSWALLAFFIFVPLLPFNSLARNYNHINGQRSPDYDRYGALNWLAIVVGGLFLLLVAYGATLPEAGYY
jgi:hypothetical protein